MLGYAKVYFHLPYRQTEGIVKGHAENKLPSIPDFSTINRRINRMDIKIKYDNSTSNKRIANIEEGEDSSYIIIAIDSTGIKVTNRGQWMNKKWNVRRRKKVYLKIHVAVNIKTKKILLSMAVTDEHVHDSKMLPQLVDKVKTNVSILDKLLADGAYDSNDIFRFLSENGILPCIKVRKNARIRLKTGHILRNLSVIVQRNDLQRWKEDSIVSYGKR